MKKIVCILLLLVICAMTVSCASSEVEVPDGMKLASGSGELYYLFVPNAWTVKEGSPASAFVSASDMSNVSVVAYVLENEVKTENTDEAQNPRAPYIDAFWAEFCDDASTTLVEFDVSEEIIDTQTLGGYYAKQFVYTHKAGGVAYKHRIAVTYYGEMIIYLIYSSTAENYDSHAADVDSIVKEFKFKQ